MFAARFVSAREPSQLNALFGPAQREGEANPNSDACRLVAGVAVTTNQ